MPQPRRKPTPEEKLAIARQLATLSHEDKAQLAARAKPLINKRSDQVQTVNGKINAPQTDDELHAWIKERTGIDIPRVAVCEDHDAPFDITSDAYFNREDALFEIGSRESGKTLKASILHYVNAETKPRIEGLTFGAIEPQARRAYKHLGSFLYEEVEQSDGTVKRLLSDTIDGEPLRSETRWKNGSQVEIVVGSKSGVNSPHPQVVHADEVDLMDEEVWAESRNMSSSKQKRDGTWINAQDYATSTRKSMTGLVQKLWAESKEAIEKGLQPAWRFYISCIFENAAEVPDCRRADPDERRKRLEELGLDPCSLCSCNTVTRGEWDENTPRTLESVCRGRFFRSRGWMLHSDVKRKFRANTQAVWEAQMECRRPMADGLYIPGWARNRFVTTNWMPRPEYGNVWSTVDWGGSALSFVLWFQGPLRVPVTLQSVNGEMTVPRGAFVTFDELYEANIGATRLADLVVARELSWRRQVAGFRVTDRFADMAGKQARDDWREHKPPLLTHWFLGDRKFDPMVKTIQTIVEDKLYYIDSRASRHIDDVEAWRQKDGKEVHDDASHSAAAMRYGICNVAALERKRNYSEPTDSIMPVVVQRQTSPNSGVAAIGASDSFSGEKAWREKLGGPMPMGWQ